MQKSIRIANRIRKDLQKDWTEEIEAENLQYVFQPLDELPTERHIKNTLICAVIFSYDNDSTWIETKHDGVTINTNILKGLNADLRVTLFQDFIHEDNEQINETIGNYLDLIQGDWRFVTARRNISYHAKYIRISENESDFSEVAAEKKSKAREDLGRLMREAVNQRKAADDLLKELHKDYVLTQHRVSQSLGTLFVEDSVKKDPYSWRDFIVHELPLIKERNKRLAQ